MYKFPVRFCSFIRLLSCASLYVKHVILSYGILHGHYCIEDTDWKRSCKHLCVGIWRWEGNYPNNNPTGSRWLHPLGPGVGLMWPSLHKQNNHLLLATVLYFVSMHKKHPPRQSAYFEVKRSKYNPCSIQTLKLGLLQILIHCFYLFPFCGRYHSLQILSVANWVPLYFI